MPGLGRPAPTGRNKLLDIQMGPRNQGNPSIDDANEKERLLNKLTGYKPEQGKFVDKNNHNKMGKDEFLKLLTHQLANQDPHKPMDQKAMSAQLAQFSQLEQLTNLNTKFDKLTSDNGVEDKFYGASFLGKEIVTNGSSLKLNEDGGQADILYKLPKAASKVMIRVFDKQNAMVGEMWKENIGRGNQTMTWDGTRLDGQASEKGEYRIQVYAWDQNTDPIQVETKTRGIVESVTFENGEAVLMASGKKVFLRDVESFHNIGASKLAKIQKESKGNVAVNNLPLESAMKKSLQSKGRINNALNAYPDQGSLSTGITSVYDVE